jgi:uncharacterized protein (DUF2249 family)
MTYKLKEDKVSKGEGVRYVGDGSWGVPENPCTEQRQTPRPELFEYREVEHPNHVWKVRVFRNPQQQYSIEYKAININNTIDFSVIDNLAR